MIDENYKIDITLPAAHFYGKEWWIDQMVIWCLQNSIEYTINQWPYANEQHGWTSQWLFNNSEDAVLFALRWKENDWGMMWHPA
jgi:hypothetical protein